ncbi:choice-of-anchor B family protein [Luteirhabdus pelagi]|uniref:choice-of-anchor B family protein n=1 Tax=Luteirhabdus pelagi TaxID=2792783 RepID=UPI00193AD1EC|nr:choice-of-anchor B family protein [Luteirhabdus pelagi]
MKHFTFLFLLSLSIVNAQTPCENGLSADFPCEGYALMSQIPLSNFDAESGNDSWGWTDPQDGKEYVLMGLNNGTAFIDITDPVNPVYLGKLPSNGQDALWGNWRDMKVYQNHTFIVSEIENHGMQVFDLTKLREVTNPPQTFSADALYTGFGSAHNIAINEDSGFAYALGGDTFNGGAHFVNIQDPTNPVAAGGHSADDYSHDAQIVTYIGPDPDYQGREIFVGSNENEVVIVDVTDKGSPQTIATLSYNNATYAHQGWFTEDQHYFIVTDELDEIFVGNDLRLIIMDFTDLDNPVVHMQYLGETPAVDHNVYVKDDKAYLAAYTAGMRVIDLSDVENMNMEEIGVFDTWPADDNTSASIGDPGAWNVYPFFESNNIAITNFSDNGGLFIVRDETLPLQLPANNSASVSVFPNPVSSLVTFQLETMPIDTIEVFDITGKQLLAFDAIGERTVTIDLSSLSQGLYMARVNGQAAVRVVKQ